ncbi:MAG: SDR family oxidoreductase [Burkholderiaceae bacterium]|nr:SDR family oxidoreductase [Burkholderiaceae bacterium]MCD8515746.1 SDR family oxidoreductase [Burkholderiaceae bacterium]MCD8536504.1 SDR family oxidoreductase [Burkholderiaceae bacterium]MCD8564910.1 SDR family oxidoreductase [Burkholderiaceae bacterium]
MEYNKVLVTGGSGGIGRAIAKRLTEDGYRVINLDRVAPKSLQAGEEFIEVDLMDWNATKDVLEPLAVRGDVVRVVNNAGFIRPGLLEDASVEDLQAVIELNLRAPLLVAQTILPAMRRAKFGRIVNIASRAALGKELRTVYSATKAGLLGMTRTWALEEGANGVTVNAIGPGPIATELFISGNPPDSPKTKQIIETIPVKRMGEPADIAHAAASLLDDRAGFITGQILYVCGGMTVGLSHTA